MQVGPILPPCICLATPHFIRAPALIPYTEEAHDKYREWSAETIDKFLRCIFGGAQYKVRALFTFVLGLPNLALYHTKR